MAPASQASAKDMRTASVRARQHQIKVSHGDGAELDPNGTQFLDSSALPVNPKG